MYCITVQNINVFYQLTRRGIYKASMNRVSPNLKEPYKFMKEFYGYKTCPIFLMPVGSKVELSGAHFQSSVAIELDIPKEYIQTQDYYNWTDFIYFMEHKNEFAKTFDTNIFQTVEDYGRYVLEGNHKKNVKQVSVECIKKEWITNVLSVTSELRNKHENTGGANTLKRLEKYRIV